MSWQLLSPARLGGPAGRASEASSAGGVSRCRPAPGHLHPRLPPNHLSPSCLLGSGEQGPFQAPDGSSRPNAWKNAEPTALDVTPASGPWLSIRGPAARPAAGGYGEWPLCPQASRPPEPPAHAGTHRHNNSAKSRVSVCHHGPCTVPSGVLSVWGTHRVSLGDTPASPSAGRWLGQL